MEIIGGRLPFGVVIDSFADPFARLLARVLQHLVQATLGTLTILFGLGFFAFRGPVHAGLGGEVVLGQILGQVTEPGIGEPA